MANTTPPDLKRLLNPTSVAVVGASAARMKPGGRTVRYLRDHGFPGQIYPVNPGRQEINGLRCYPSLSAIGRPMDAVLVSVPAAEVPQVIAEAIKTGAGGAIIFSGGFNELGTPEGDELHRQLTDLVQESGFPVLGPNSAGCINFHARATLSMGIIFEGQPPPRPGRVSMITQGGGSMGMVYPHAVAMGMDFSYWLNSGNEAGILASDCIRYAADDPETRVIIAYFEGIRDAAGLLAAGWAARRAGKPVLAVKAGRTAAGARAAASHTGAAAVPDRVAQAFLRKAGIVSVDDPWELLGAAQLLKEGKPSPGPNVVVLTNSGSMGSLIADAVELHGLHMLQLSESTLDALRQKLPPVVQAGNPVDVTTPPLLDGEPILAQTAAVVTADDQVHNLVIALMITPGFPLEVLCPQIGQICRDLQRPAVAIMTGYSGQEAAERLWAEGVPSYVEIPRAIRALAAARAAAEMGAAIDRMSPVVQPPVAPPGGGAVMSRSRRTLNEADSAALVSRYGVPMARSAAAANAGAAAAAAAAIGYPVALKVLSADIPHKSDVGGVQLNVGSRTALLGAAAMIRRSVRSHQPQARLDGFLVQEMCRKGVEVVVGATRDPVFGPTIMFGLGGVAVDLFQDVALGISPLTREEALDLIKRTRSFALLNGFRGALPCDVAAVVDLILAVDRLMQAEPQVLELDLNPVLVYPAGRGVRVADALVVVAGE